VADVKERRKKKLDGMMMILKARLQVLHVEAYGGEKIVLVFEE
jgi:hypothetical protein